MKMNRTEWLVVALCAVAVVWLTTTSAPPRRAPAPEAPVEAVEPAATAETTPPESPPEPDTTPPEETVFRNEVAEYTFTNRGGGIATVRILEAQYAGKTEQILNAGAPGAIGSLSREPGTVDTSLWTIQEKTDRSITYSTVRDGFEITKKWTMSDRGSATEGWGYLWNLEVRVRNTGSEAAKASYHLYSGALGPLHSNDWIPAAASWSEDGDAEELGANAFNASRFLGFLWQTRGPRQTIIEEPENMLWGGVHNQYYTILISGSDPKTDRVTSLWLQRFPTVFDDPGRGQVKGFAIEAGTGLPAVQLDPGGEMKWSGEVYTGPRSGTVLNRLGNDRNGVMHYGMFRSLSRLFLGMLNKFYGWVSSYAIAIMMLTLVVRIVIWPLHIKATRAMKLMSKMSPLMAELKEKYQNDPQKMQVETMKLYREYNVNPLGGCLPLLLQFPIFLGYYGMMRSAVEMRGHSFLWVKDLSMPDTVFTIPGINLPVNPLPLLMTVTMYIQMAVSPKPAETNPQIAMQQKIFKFMPLLFLFFCYGFASALALYWTVQNIISIGQTKLMSLQPEPELTKRPPRPAGSSFLERAMAAQQARQQSLQQQKKGSKQPRTGTGRSSHRKGRP